MANLADHKTVSPPFSNAKEIVRVEYDFANDAGAIGVLVVNRLGEAIINMSSPLDGGVGDQVVIPYLHIQAP